MVLVTALLPLFLLPHIQSVKVVIDGTIDFGPKWNYEYKLKPINGFEPRKTISNNPNNRLTSKNSEAEQSEKGYGADTIEVLRDTDKNSDESSSGKIDAEKYFKVTKLYETDDKHKAMFRTPRKIKDETEVIKFVNHIKNESLKMFDNFREKVKDGAIVQKINELKERYAKKLGEFENQTKNHIIRTTLGNKKVILNTIDYSNKLLNRLVNRLKIDTEENGFRNGIGASKIFQEHKEHLKNLAYEDACRMFSICRAGNEFSDHISNFITTLLQHNDSKVELVTKAVAKALKTADFSNIMDEETHKAFNKTLSSLEELNPFELRVLLMAYKLILDNRHQPFFNRRHRSPWVNATVAMFHVLEGFNNKVIIDNKDWNVLRKDFSRWLAGEHVDVKDIASMLVHRVQRNIAALDNKTANDFKDKLRMCILAKELRINLSSYVQFQPFVI